MRMLGFFFRHYEPWVQKFFFFDDGSTDGTLDLLRSKANVELRRLPYPHPESLSLSVQAWRNQCWKESRGAADWVIVTDVDEHLHHPRIEAYLSACKRRGVTYMPALGFDMVTDSFPARMNISRGRGRAVRPVPTTASSEFSTQTPSRRSIFQSAPMPPRLPDGSCCRRRTGFSSSTTSSSAPTTFCRETPRWAGGSGPATWKGAGVTTTSSTPPKTSVSSPFSGAVSSILPTRTIGRGAIIVSGGGGARSRAAGLTPVGGQIGAVRPPR